MSDEIKKLHLGCGRNILKGWINTDIKPSIERYRVNATHLDVTEKFSYENNEIDYIFSEHMIEHISYESGKFMLEECYRVLKPGGKIRISTPDLKFLINLYNENKTDLQKEYINYCMGHDAYDIIEPMDTFIINNFVRAWGHIFIYDEKTLKFLLDSIGFKDIKLCKITESDDEHLRNLENIDDPTNKRYGLTKEILQFETFTLEGTK